MAEEKSGANSAGLAWPPTKEDLQRLYVDQKLSAAKIAKVYGLEYASVKTAESTVLHHLKKNGINRRDPAEHIRKITEEMVDAWVVRYQNGESLKQIAGDAVDPVSVFNHLHKRGVRLRDKVEAQIEAVTKFRKFPFDGTERDRAYLLGFARGDLNVKRHGRAIRVKTTSSHPAMIELFISLFCRYGPTREYPKFFESFGHEWTVEGELDRTFEFLLTEKLTPPIKSNVGVVLAYLAGLFDAEGSLWLRSNRSFGPRLSYTNKDLDMLSWIETHVNALGFNARRVGPDENGVYRVLLWRNKEVLDFIRLLPIRHPEKKAKARLLLNASQIRSTLYPRWQNLLNGIDADCATFLKEAEYEFSQDERGSLSLERTGKSISRLNRKHQRANLLR